MAKKRCRREREPRHRKLPKRRNSTPIKTKEKSKRARVSTASLNKYSIFPDQVSFPFCPDDLTNSISLIEFIILFNRKYAQLICSGDGPFPDRAPFSCIASKRRACGIYYFIHCHKSGLSDSIICFSFTNQLQFPTAGSTADGVDTSGTRNGQEAAVPRYSYIAGIGYWPVLL